MSKEVYVGVLTDEKYKKAPCFVVRVELIEKSLW